MYLLNVFPVDMAKYCRLKVKHSVSTERCSPSFNIPATISLKCVFKQVVFESTAKLLTVIQSCFGTKALEHDVILMPAMYSPQTIELFIFA